MQNKLPDIGAKLEEDQHNDLEMRKLNDTEKFTLQVLSCTDQLFQLTFNLYLLCLRGRLCMICKIFISKKKRTKKLTLHISA